MKAPELFPVVMVTNMKREPTSKPLAFSKKQMEAAIAAAPDQVSDPECLYNPNDAASVAAFWAKARFVFPASAGRKSSQPKWP